MGFPGSSYNKESACKAVGLGLSPGEENSYPLQYSCWRIPWMKEPDRLQSVGLQRFGHD